jgi:hypothetical protein
LGSEDTSEPSDARSNRHGWLLLYKYYLTAAVVLAGIGVVRVFKSRSEFITDSGFFTDTGQVTVVDSIFFISVIIIYPLVLGLVQIGLFIFAVKSLRQITEGWVRTFHLSINGVAVIAVILGNTFQIVGLGSIPFLAILNNVAGVVVFPLHALIPWTFLHGISPNVGQLVFWATSLVIIWLAAVWWIRWRDLRYVWK